MSKREIILKTNPELLIATTFLAFMLAVAAWFGLPIVSPAGDRAAFVGIHYIYPLLGIAVLGGAALVFGNRKTAARFMIALPCYTIVLFAHFNLKLWIPHINPHLFDELYMSIDETFRFLVDFCIFARETVFGFIPHEANFYMLLFIALFHLSFLYFAIKAPQHFGRLTVAVLLQQSLGSIGYLIAPALGPFIYEDGIVPRITEAQAGMLGFYQSSVAHGPAWLAEHGSAGFVAGLAAMPSLHMAGAVLFLMFAWRYARFLVPFFVFSLAFITVTSVASRWHYLIDLPFGALLAWVCFKLAHMSPARFGLLESDALPVGTGERILKDR